MIDMAIIVISGAKLRLFSITTKYFPRKKTYERKITPIRLCILILNESRDDYSMSLASLIMSEGTASQRS